MPNQSEAIAPPYEAATQYFQSLEARISALESTLAAGKQSSVSSGTPLERPAPAKKARSRTKAKGQGGPTLKDIRSAYIAAMEVTDKEAARAAVQSVAGDIKQLPDVAPEHYPAVIKALESLATNVQEAA